jgi:glucokinase
MTDLIIGVDIGGTKTRAGLVDAANRLIASAERPTPATEGPKAILANVGRLAKQLIGNNRFIACGVGTAGVVDAASGTIVSSTSALSGWAGTHASAHLERLLGVPTVVENDVNCFGLGEQTAGAAAGADSVLAVTVGTGIGGALISGGMPRKGAHSSAGEVGHIPLHGFDDRLCPCGRNGHLEAVAAGPAMVARFCALGGTASNLQEVAAVAAHDARAATSLVEGAHALGLSLAGLVNSFDPNTVVLGGGVTCMGSIWWEEVRRTYVQHLLPSVSGVDLRTAALGPDSVLIGAAQIARLVVNESAAGTGIYSLVPTRRE